MKYKINSESPEVINFSNAYMELIKANPSLKNLTLTEIMNIEEMTDISFEVQNEEHPSDFLLVMSRKLRNVMTGEERTVITRMNDAPLELTEIYNIYRLTEDVNLLKEASLKFNSYGNYEIEMDIRTTDDEIFIKVTNINLENDKRENIMSALLPLNGIYLLREQIYPHIISYMKAADRVNDTILKKIKEDGV